MSVYELAPVADKWSTYRGCSNKKGSPLFTPLWLNEEDFHFKYMRDSVCTNLKWHEMIVL